MNLEIVSIIILALIAAYLFFRVWVVKRDLKNIKKELDQTCMPDCDSQMRVSLWDKDAIKLAEQINKNLDYQKQLKMDTEQSKKQMEQAVADIAHDLRTPLTVIKGNLRMLENENLSDRGKVYLQISNTKAETLKKMVDCFFEMSVLESDTQEVPLQKIDLIEFMAGFLIENETLIKNKGLNPEIRFPEKSVYIQADHDMLTRVLGNIMSNILKYAMDPFTISVVENEDRATLTIANGIKEGDPIDVDHIFDRTYRADKARTDGSAGLGLYIAKLLVKKMKGNIEATLEDDQLQFVLSFFKA